MIDCLTEDENDALETWLSGKSDHTQRSYLQALNQFFEFQDVPAHEVTPSLVTAWKKHMQENDLSNSTISHRLSSLSSYFAYLSDPKGDGIRLVEYNPVTKEHRQDLKVSPYEGGLKISEQEFKRMLRSLDSDREVECRDRALMVFYVLCGRRRSEVLQLRGQDLRRDHDGNLRYRVKLKGGKVKWKKMTPEVESCLEEYLHKTHRSLQTLQDDEPLWLPSTNAARTRHRKNGNQTSDTIPGPVSGSTISQNFKKYARQVGINPKHVSIHSLRHLGAKLHYEKSNDVQETQAWLDHKNLNTTQRYLEQLRGEDNPYGSEMAKEIGLGG